MAQIAMQRLDIVLVAAISGPVAAATYTAATRFVVLGQFARNAVSLAVQPHLASALTSPDRADADRIFSKSTAWLMAVTWPLFFALLVGGEQLLGVFGHGYNAGAAVLVFLSLSMLVNTVCGDVDIVLIMAGRTTWSLANTMVALVLQVGLDVILIPGHGVLGAAVAWSVAITAKSLIALVQVWVLLRMHPFSAAPLFVGAAGALCYGAVAALLRWWSVGPVDGLAVGWLVATALYVVAIWMARGMLGLSEVFQRRPAPAGIA
jgi:O-antigen/teichoic acid export membrane protein